MPCNFRQESLDSGKNLRRKCALWSTKTPYRWSRFNLSDFPLSPRPALFYRAGSIELWLP